MNYDNYFAGGGFPQEPEFVNAMGRGAQTQAQAPATKPMTMEEWAAFFRSLTPEQLADFQYKGPDFGGGNPLESIMGMFGGKGKTGEGG